MEECEETEWQNVKDWAWDDREVYKTLYGGVMHFLAGWFDEFQIDFNQNQYPHISMDDLDSLFEDSPEVEVTEKDGAFYAKAVFYTNCEKKKDNPNRRTCARKTINLVYRVDRSKYPIIQHIDGRTDLVEDECPKAREVMEMEGCEKTEWEDKRAWVWDESEAYTALYRSMVHFLTFWFDKFQVSLSQNQRIHISRDELNRLFEDSDELEVKEKDGAFYLKAVFYVNRDRKKDDPSKCIWTRKTLNVVYRVDKSSPDAIVLQHIDGKTDIVEDSCSRAS